MRGILREIGVTASGRCFGCAQRFYENFSVKHIKETLARRRAEFPVNFELGGVLHESRTQSWACVHDSSAGFHARERRADECVRCEQQMIPVLRAARLAGVIFFETVASRFFPGVSFFEIPHPVPTVSANS